VARAVELANEEVAGRRVAYEANACTLERQTLVANCAQVLLCFVHDNGCCPAMVCAAAKALQYQNGGVSDDVPEQPWS
jgi:hypothetical protein